MSGRLHENARTVLEASCLVRPGESVLILAHADERRTRIARALADAAVGLGAIPAVLELTEYTSLYTRAPEECPVLPPVKAAIESADVVVRVAGPGYETLLGDADGRDAVLTARQRRVHLQLGGIEEWQITADEVRAIRTRTEWLLDLLDSSDCVRVTSPAGTDFSFSLRAGAKWLPILGIVPLYGEVAITPQQGSKSGVFVVDGPTQMGVRPQTELDRPALTIEVENGRVQDTRGDATQVQRLRAFIASGDPPADRIDEVGVLTTKIEANDRYHWSDGTHHHDCVHIALGNNARRDTLVHGPCHMDGEVRRPTICVDGVTIVDKGLFVDSLIESGGSASPPSGHQSD